MSLTPNASDFQTVSSADLHLANDSLPVTEQLCSEVLSLPIFPELSSDQQDHVIRVLCSLLKQPEPSDTQACSVAV